MNKIIKTCLLALAFIPFIVDKTVFFPYGGGKVIFMRGVLFLVSTLFLFSFFYFKKFKEDVIQKVNIFIRNPLVISLIIFVLISIISTIFAVDKYSAFWGNIERAEGLVGILYLTSFFTFSLLIFEKKDWIWFFRLSLFASFVLLFKEFTEFFGGGRIISFVGSSTFLAGYLLFSIFSAITVFSEDKNKFFQYFSISILSLSILGIFMAQNRGTIVGLVFGFIGVLIYVILRGKDTFYKKLNLKRASIIILCFLFVFINIFIATRNSFIWQRVPGFSRIAVIGSKDATTQTRLIMAKLSLRAVDPTQNGIKKFLIGWGPDNFGIAYGKYFNPVQFKYETSWFDRSHNKLLDVLVMTGLLGLIAYLFIYFFFLRCIFKIKKFSLINIGLSFFILSFLGYLLFAFNQITTFIPFFAVLSFAVFLSTNHDNQNKIVIPKKSFIYISMFLLVSTSFIFFVFLRGDLPAYIQMRRYLSLLETSNPQIVLNKIDKIFEPVTPAQADIRSDFLSFISANYNPNNEAQVKLFNIAILRSEEYTKMRPYDLNFSVGLADVYRNKGNDFKNLEFLIKAEEYYKQALIYAPERPDYNYGLALDYLFQKKYNESFDLFEKVFESSPEYFSIKDQNIKGPEGVYGMFTKYFYYKKDKANFIRAVNRLIKNNYVDSVILDKIVKYIEKTDIWPIIDFK